MTISTIIATAASVQELDAACGLNGPGNMSMSVSADNANFRMASILTSEWQTRSEDAALGVEPGRGEVILKSLLSS